MVSAVVAIPDPRCGTAPAHRYSVGSATNAEMNWALSRKLKQKRGFLLHALDQASERNRTCHQQPASTSNCHLPQLVLVTYLLYVAVLSHLVEAD